MVDLELKAYMPEDLGCEILPQEQDSAISGDTNINSLAEHSRHSASKYRDSSEKLHP